MTFDIWFANNLHSIALFVVIFEFMMFLITSLFLDRFHIKIYGTGTKNAWIPILKFYILGKLAVNKLTGIIYFIAFLIVGYIGSESYRYKLFVTAFGIYFLIGTIFYILILIKNHRIKKGTLSLLLALLQCESMSFQKVVEPTEGTEVVMINNTQK